MRKVHILAIKTITGVSYHRVIKPMELLKTLYPHFYDIHYLDVEDKDSLAKLPDLRFYKFDVIYFNTMIGAKEGNPALNYIQGCLMKGAKIVMDIDDHFVYGRSVVVSDKIKNEHKQRIPEALKTADYVTTTTDEYAGILKEYTPKVSVFANFADFLDDQYVPKKTNLVNAKGEKIIRIGVTGSVMHKYDMKILSGVARALKKNGFIHRVQFVLAGYANNKYYYEYERILTNNYSIVSPAYKKKLLKYANKDVSADNEPYRRIGWMASSEYMAMYNDIDVLLAPLENTEFNRAKSQIKYVEAGAMRTLFVGSNVPSYNRFVTDSVNGFLCENNKDFELILSLIVDNWDNTNGFSDVIDKAYEDVRENYSSFKVTEQRHKFFQTIEL